MFKKFIKNIIPLALLLHISSCSSFGVSKSEMDGACGIIDQTLETDSENLNNIEGPIGGQEINIKNLVTGDNAKGNIFLLDYLKKDIIAWEKKDFDKAVVECVINRSDKEYKLFLYSNELTIQKFDASKNTFFKYPTYYYPNDLFSNTYNVEYSLPILKKNAQGYEAHLACARLIAVDLDKTTNKLSYRVKYLPYIFRSGSNNLKSITDSVLAEKKKISELFSSLFEKLDKVTNFSIIPNNNTALNKTIQDILNWFKNILPRWLKDENKTLLIEEINKSIFSTNNEFISQKDINNIREEIKNRFIEKLNIEKISDLCPKLRFVEDYGFNGNFNDCQHGHLDSERALLLCLTENTPSSFPFEKPYKLANFVHPNTIDLCIQVRNQNPMCGNCQCFYVGIDKADLNSTGGLFLERGEPDDTSGFNILSILKRMEKYKKQEDVNHKENNYKNSLFLATRRGQEDTFFSGTKHQIGNKDYNPENIINGSLINTDQNASDDYEVAKGNFYSRSDYTQKIHIHKTNCKCIQCDKKNKKK